MSGFAFKILATDGAARRGRLSTNHGTLETPAFMPVGTAGTVKAMTSDAVAATGAEMVLGNTYHLMLRPGAETIERLVKESKDGYVLPGLKPNANGDRGDAIGKRFTRLKQ